MIENLNGTHETVNFMRNTHLRLHHNTEPENYPPHWHVPAEIIMPLESSYTAECCGHIYQLQENDILILASCCLHSLFAPASGSRIIFQPDLSVLHSIRALETIQTLLAPAVLITPESAPQLHGQVRSLLLEIQKEYLCNTPFSEAVIYGKLLEMFVMIGRSYAGNTELPPAGHRQRDYSEKFIDICSYISLHCSEELTLEETAHLAGFSKYHFTRLFKQYTGQSFYRYVNRKRIGKAEKLLADPKYTITDVALLSGFASMSSFIRMFRLFHGCTPTAFRQLHHTRT